MDSLPGILQTIEHTIRAVGYEPPENLRSWAGPPFPKSLREQLGLSDPEVERAVTIYRAHYLETGTHLSTPFVGMPELLRDAHAQGRPQATATSKPITQAREMLKREGLIGLFHTLGAANDDETRSDKRDVISDALTGLQAAGIDTTGVVLVGDRIHDYEAAHEMGITSIAATWGYGTKSEWEHADIVVTTVGELRSVLGL